MKFTSAFGRLALPLWVAKRPSSEGRYAASSGRWLSAPQLIGSGRSADATADANAVVYALPVREIEELERTAPHVVIRLYRNIASHLSVRLRNSTALVRSR